MSIQLVAMSQLDEALGSQDDWTGLTDAASRRKRQNRLNVRAYRRRKALEARNNQAATSTVEQIPVKVKDPTVACWVEDQQTIINIPISVVDTTFGTTQKPLLTTAHENSLTRAEQTPHKIIFPLCPDHLITLLQYNVLRAGITNRKLLSPVITVTSCSSDSLHVLPEPSLPNALPPSLYPTHLQRTIPHEDWVDIIPHPRWRDNLILALGTFDEDELWSDTIGGLFEGFPQSEIEHRGVIVWSPPWDVSGWEITEGFWNKWKWLLTGCEDMLVATNYWRAKRGEYPLVF
ncbi:conserved hypothetical protein [Talaromyces stipitatus ATCC 10500]|uniref:BZIP domain-containing protein n=1 Tax=Talaromyces stipitatus (strain ATCC 10500 / CBS 375.48 / QM 6759 / NRRL 1006) TaxID=441959 RepID=B8MS81_TALSN|nr:uncharacterized protein TSTA_002060 [Talaromyces stipitatus ATCC 10500]EED12139.1 conserved hypothetical protein [Talaromyces stipitatus ATCC 10500]